MNGPGEIANSLVKEKVDLGEAMFVLVGYVVKIGIMGGNMKGEGII